MGLWQDTKIIQAALDPDCPLVVPYNEANVNPGSYDLIMGPKIRLPHPIWRYLSRKDQEMLVENVFPWASFDAYHASVGKRENLYELVASGDQALSYLERLPKWGDEQDLGPNGYVWLYPGDFILSHSLEFVSLPLGTTSFLSSKSSTGRVGLEHLHAGLGDAGWKGQWVFEFHIVAPWALKLVVGRRIMQMVVLDMREEAAISYAAKGKYQNQTGTVTSRNKEV